MPLLNWTDEFKTNIRAIDNDHRLLVDIVNGLHEAVSDGRVDETAAEQGLTALVLYVEDHFRREEAFMRASGYPRLAEHMRRHQELAFAVYEIQHMFRQDPQSLLRPEVWEFLGNWLSMHVRGCDLDYVPWLRGEKEGEPQPPGERWRAVTMRVPARALPTLFRAAALLGEGGEKAEELRRFLEGKRG